jgi:hypothetical protein
MRLGFLSQDPFIDHSDASNPFSRSFTSLSLGLFAVPLNVAVKQRERKAN